MRGRLSSNEDYFLKHHQPGSILFFYLGSLPSKIRDILFFPGWNMVGFPSLSNEKSTAALNNLVYVSQINTISWFDAACQSWKEVGEEDDLEVGKGYWIYAKTKCVWEVR